MVATLLLAGVLRGSARAFAAITGSLVQHNTLRGVRKAKDVEAWGIIHQTLILSPSELDALDQSPEWVLGKMRADALKNHGGLDGGKAP